MTDTRRFEIPLRMRCVHRGGGPDFGRCRELARWRDHASSLLGEVVWCDRHRSPSSTPFAGERAYRRIQLSAQVFLAATASSDAGARAEAYEELHTAVIALGGALNVLHVTAETGLGELLAAPDWLLVDAVKG